MRGILINNLIHTGNDLDLVMTGKNLQAPKLQSQKVEIPGRNGALDLTEALTGGPVYDNRTLTFTFFGNGSRDTVLYLIDTMLAYHGRYITIVVDDVEDWYYEGRVEVAYSDKYHYVEFELTVDAQPFKQAIEPKIYMLTNVTSKNIVIENEGVRVLPTVTVTANTTIVVGEITYTLSAGTYEPDELLLVTGENIWTVTTTGTITISYREAKI
jgi:phage-related protein